MGNSLSEQLLKTGLVDETSFKKSQKAKRQQAKQRRKGRANEVDPGKLAAQRAQAEQRARDQELNRQRKAEAETKAIAAQVRQLIESNRQPRGDGDLPYHFTDGGKVKRVYISEQVQRTLAAGQLAIVRLDEKYELVPVAVAEKIRQRDPDAVISIAKPAQEQNGNDPYSEYQVPDDLIW